MLVYLLLSHRCLRLSSFLFIPFTLFYFIRSPGLETCRGIQILSNSGRTSLVLLFSSSWVTHLVGMGFDFTVIAALLPSCWSFFFVFGFRESFIGVFQHPSVDGCSTASCNFGVPTGGDEHVSFYSDILNQKS